MTFAPGRRRAFTLVELLGVILVLAVLAAITFPAINSAIAKSRTSSCAQNLRQWGLATLQFVGDQGHFPNCNAKYRVNGSNTKAYRIRWYHALAPYMGADPAAKDNQQNDGAAGLNGWSWGNGDQDQSVFNEAFKCPEVPNWDVGRNNSYGYNYQYLGNDRARSTKDDSGTSPLTGARPKRGYIRFPVVPADVPRPERTVLIADSDGTGSAPYTSHVGANPPNDMRNMGNHGYLIDPTFLPLRDCDQDGNVDDRPGPSDAANSTGKEDRNYYNYTAAASYGVSPDASTQSDGAPWNNNAARGIVSNRHNGGANVVFADGHVEWLLREDFYFDEQGRKSNRLWNGLGRDNKDVDTWSKDPADVTFAASEVIDPNEEIFVDPATNLVVNWGNYTLVNEAGTPATTDGTTALGSKNGDPNVVLGTEPKVPPLRGNVYHEAVGDGT